LVTGIPVKGGVKSGAYLEAGGNKAGLGEHCGYWEDRPIYEEEELTRSFSEKRKKTLELKGNQI